MMTYFTQYGTTMDRGNDGSLTQYGTTDHSTVAHTALNMVRHDGAGVLNMIQQMFPILYTKAYT